MRQEKCCHGQPVVVWMFVLLMLLLSACGGGGETETAPTAASSSYFPAAVGNRWVYLASSGDSAEPPRLELVEVSGNADVQGTSAVVLRSFNAADGSDIGVEYLSVTDAGVARLPDPALQPGDRAIPAMDLLRFPLVVGSSYEQMNKTFDIGADYDGDGVHESLRIVSQVSVVGMESVQTDAAVFADAAHVRTVVVQTGTYSAGGAPFISTATVDGWYAPGVGLVREDTVTTSSGGLNSSRHVTLVGYSVDGVRSEVVAPVATLVSPSLLGEHTPFTVIQLDFSEPMDASSMGAQAIELRDPTGALVSVSVFGSGASWSFYPTDGLLTGGVYTVSVSNSATDLLGNPAAVASWSFAVDATIPIVVATFPAQDAKSVPIDVVITLDFSEEIDPSTVSGAIQLAGRDYLPVDVSVVGRRITVKPQSKLQPRTSYQLVVGSSLRDKAGNSIGVSYTLSFQTDPGQFGFAQQMNIGSSQEAAAVGDVTGDGRTDVVMTNSVSFDPATDNKLFVFPQQADGTLGAPLAYATQASENCAPSSVAVADVNGDGRKDVIIGESGCGIEIFLQDASGQLVSGGLIASAESHKIRAADLDGDGRVDIAGVGWGTSQVAVWKQTASGALAGPTLYALEHFGWEDLDIGDINGDGRLDLVATSAQGDASKALAFLPQQADGSFGHPFYRSLDGVTLGWAVAVGDINGDGRHDVVVSRSYESSIGVFYQDASGNLGEMKLVAANAPVEAIEVADVDGDGAGDIVILDVDGFGVYSQQGNGTLGAFEHYSAPRPGQFNPQALAVGDINGDGHPDLIGTGLTYLLNRASELPSAGVAGPAAVKAGVPGKQAGRRGWVPLQRLPVSKTGRTAPSIAR